MPSRSTGAAVRPARRPPRSAAPRADRPGAVVAEVRDLRVAHEVEPTAHRRRIARCRPDDIVETAADAEGLAKPPLLVLDRVRAFLDEHGLGSGDLARSGSARAAARTSRSCSSATRAFVLRRPPRPPLPPSGARRRTRGAAPARAARGRVRAAADDRRGLRGREPARRAVLRHGVPRRFRPDRRAAAGLENEPARRALGDDLVDALVEIHAADVTTPGARGFARPGSYNERQVRRFTQLWEINKTREVPRVEEVGAWLADNVPEPLPATVVHGDFRLGNTMVARDEPSRIVAVLDWEMGAIGDPRADVGYLLATYSEPGGRRTRSARRRSPRSRLPVEGSSSSSATRAERTRRRAARPGSRGSRSGRRRSSARRSTAVSCAASSARRTRVPRAFEAGRAVPGRASAAARPRSGGSLGLDRAEVSLASG